MVTAAVLPPTALAMLPGERFPLPGTLMVAGEACSPELADIWAAGRRFFNGYGLTETSVWSNAARCEPGGGQPPIGRPIRNTQVYVLDRDLEPTGAGIPGEIFVGGACVARCYLNRPELTASRFVPDPYGAPGSRLFRTGDLGRHRADGSLEYLGRRDTQVKLRGLRIELGEIESAMRQMPEVREAVVLLRDDLPGEPRLAGYVVPAPAAEPSAQAIGQHLRARVPKHMIPGQWVFLESLPLTSNEKVDRRALLAMRADAVDLRASYVAPSSPAELVLTEIWREVLAVPEIGINDDFFELGGSSLSSVQVAAKAQAHGVVVTVHDLVEAPTIAQLAVRAAQPARRRAARSSIRSQVRLREGTGRPLYCVHPTGGSATWYIPLARALPEGRPVLAFQARGLVGGTDPATVPQIAANYVGELLAHGDTGPHALLGWSMGANIALEMAAQIHAAGQVVDPLVLIEPYLPSPAAESRLSRLVDHLADALRRRDRIRAMEPRSPQQATATAELESLLLGAGMTARESALAVDAPIEVWHSLLGAMASYQVRPFPGHVHLVVGQQATEMPDVQPMPGLDIDYPACAGRWSELALGGLTVHVTPGSHRTILTEPLVQDFATLISAIEAKVHP
jgi:thioesterase domain-containing protein